MRIRAVCAALIAVSSVLVVGSSSNAAEPEEGRLLAADHDPAPATYPFEWVSDSYFTHEPGPFSELRPAAWEIRSLTDGHVVDTAPNDPDVSFDSPRLAGDQVVTRTAVDGGSLLQFRGLAGAPSAGPVTVPQSDTELLVHKRGVLVDRIVSGNHTLMLLDSTGAATPISGAAPGFHPVVYDTDGDAVLIGDGTKLFVVDLATVSATPVADVPATTDWAALTRNRVVWRTDHIGDDGEHYAWRQRDGSASGTVVTPHTYTQLTIGDDLAALQVPADGTYLRTELVRISIPSGSVSAPLVSGVSSARSLADGRVVFTEDYDVSVLTSAGQKTKLADLARPVRAIAQLALAGQRVVGSVGGAGLRETTLTATDWKAVAGGPASAGSSFQLAGDVSYTEEDRTLRWPGGQRSFPQFTNVFLGRGGKYVAVQTSADFDTYSIQDTRTGAEVATRSSNLPVAIDGTWLWQGPDAATGRLTATDLVSHATKTVDTPARCAGYLTVVGRWALNTCDSANVWATDLLGVRPSFTIPGVQALRTLPVLGNGFVVDFRIVPTDPDVPELVVTDLNSASHPQRVVGPIRGRIFPPGPAYAVDQDGGARLVYVDPESRVRAVDLTWLAPPPPTSNDTTPPVLSSTALGDRVRSSTAAVRYAYGYRDNVKVASYDVGYRVATAGHALGAWTYPTAWQRTTATSVSVTPAAGTDTCFMVRARDTAGNVSGWTPQSCTAMPQDDRVMTGSGSISRLAFSSAYRGTVTRLNRSGASITKTGEYGHRIAVLTLAGPGQGSVDVYHGSRRIGRVSLAATSWSRRTVYLPVTAYLSGSVRVVSVSSLPSSIDGVALLRS